MLGLNQPLLINILGHAGGALIFAIFLCLLYSGRGWSGGRGRYLSGLAAALSMLWNLGSLAALTLPGMPPHVLDSVVAISFSVLSLLPAVLLQLSLEGSLPAISTAGYVLSGVAIAMHLREIFTDGAKLHQQALLLITVGFLALTATAVVSVAVRGPSRLTGGARIAASMCLALFAMSFIHFGQGHAHQAWSSELVVHHAGIPLALFVLLQDYRFVLLDAFVRFLANALLAAILSGIVIETGFRLMLVGPAARQPLPEAVLLISVCLFLIVFAWLRNRVQGWLTHAVFRQSAVSNLAEEVKHAPTFSTEQQYLEWSAALIAEAVRAPDYAVVAQSEVASAGSLHAPVLASALPVLAGSGRWSWTEAVVPVRLGAGNSRLILLGCREGGRRYLGDDLEALARAGAEIAERLESLRRQEMNRLVTQAELRALQSQINPHFLFNALNALYGTIPREASGARRMVLNLADVFRYFLQSDKTFVPLAEEMQIVRAYLEVEKCRLAARLNVEIEVDDAVLEVLIPVLSIQPLVENAIKHGIALRSEPGYVRIQASRLGEALQVSVENSGAPGTAPAAGFGVGLENVRRRLEICYGAAAGLQFSPGAEQTTVAFHIPLSGASVTVRSASE